ncbi:endonuclease III [Candidatus Bathyarchaeota archaeon]|nr:endonuclease III [Candidatus Bathyarchaeota archaeon]
MADSRPRGILETLRRTFDMPRRTASSRDPFKTLIITIISQNTADRNTARAFENLSKHFEITPEALAKAEGTAIEECLKVGGLYRSKTKTIQSVSRIILENFEGSLKPVLSLPLEEARKVLTKMPGVGPKTADVVLLFSANQPTIPVDTHVNRVSKRLGLVPERGDYEAVRLSLQTLYSPKDYLAVHLLLIAHGRKYCKARRPHCIECPVNNYCPSNDLGGKHD